MNRQGPSRAALHVAALPFPSHQGTQAVIAAMLAALVEGGRPSELLTYAHAGHAAELPFPVHRAIEPLPNRSLRAGPSAHKLLSDAGLTVALARLLPRLDPSALIAHHVEAGLAALLCTQRPRRPFVFFAHTDLAAELPTYFEAQSPEWRRRLGGAAALLRRSGGRLDALLVRSAGRVAAISPLLAMRLSSLPGVAPGHVRYVPPPWPLPAPITADERADARARLGIAGGAQVLLYAGNLDRYQGWEDMLAALARLGAAWPALELLVGTESDPRPLLAMAQRAGIAARIRLQPLRGEPARRALHAAADLALVPRRASGGLPIKLLDALARGLPCAIAPAASAGLPLANAVEIARGTDIAAFAASIERVLVRSADAREQLGQRARAYVAARHSAASFLRAFDALLART